MTGKRLAGFIVVLVLARSSSAAPITWAFEGEVTIIFTEIGTLSALTSLGVSGGSSFYGRLVFESDTPDGDADPAHGRYPGAISLLEVTIGSYHEGVSTDSYNSVDVSPFEFVGSYGFVSASATGPGSYTILDDPDLQLLLLGEPPGGIGSDALPVSPPRLVSYDHREFVVRGADGFIEGDLTRIVLVPEPGVGVLLALSLAAVGALGRRRA